LNRSCFSPQCFSRLCHVSDCLLLRSTAAAFDTPTDPFMISMYVSSGSSPLLSGAQQMRPRAAVFLFVFCRIFPLMDQLCSSGQHWRSRCLSSVAVWHSARSWLELLLNHPGREFAQGPVLPLISCCVGGVDPSKHAGCCARSSSRYTADFAC
jgi:hypothetical protein